jgi:hypothetical protein
MARRRLQQSDVAARMQALGYKWVRQTVGETLKKKESRRLSAEEVMALAIVLETTVRELVTPHEEDAQIVFPAGIQVTGRRLLTFDRSLTWDEKNAPVVSPSEVAAARQADEDAQELLERAIAKMLDKDDPRLAALLETVLARHAAEET